MAIPSIRQMLESMATSDESDKIGTFLSCVADVAKALDEFDIKTNTIASTLTALACLSVSIDGKLADTETSMLACLYNALFPQEDAEEAVHHILDDVFHAMSDTAGAKRLVCGVVHILKENGSDAYASFIQAAMWLVASDGQISDEELALIEEIFDAA